MSTIFTKIIQGQIPCDKVFENERIIAFKDIHPMAPIHILIVPKKIITSLHTIETEDLPLISEIVTIAQQLAQQFEMTKGYRLLTNVGADAGQTIFHLHFHLLGGKPLQNQLA